MLVRVKFSTSGLKSFGLRDQRQVEADEEYEMDDTNLHRYPEDAIEVLGPVAKTIQGPGKAVGLKKAATKKKAAKKAAAKPPKKAAKKKAGKKKASKKSAKKG